MDCYVGVADGASQLKVTIGDSARGIFKQHELCLDASGKVLAPDNWRVVGFVMGGVRRWQPYSAHAGLGGVDGTDERLLLFNDLAEVCWPVGDVTSEDPEVF